MSPSQHVQKTSRRAHPRVRLLIGLFLAVFFGLCAGLPAAATKVESVPDWVKAAASQTLPKYSDRTNAVVLRDDRTVSVGADGRATEHRRRVVKILRPQGREDARIFLPFDSETKLTDLHVWSIGPDGHEYTLRDKEIGEVGFPGQGSLYMDLHARVAEAPGRDPGGIVAYEYDQRSHAYVNETTWHFQSEIPALAQSFTLELPAGYSFGSVWSHHEPVKPADLEHMRWRWELKDVPAIDLDDMAYTPDEAALAGRVTVHYAGSATAAPVGDTWKSVGQWYRTLESNRLDATPEIAAKAKDLAGASPDFYTRVEPVAEFVQRQIRYFVIEMGIGGYQPHAAAEIFRNRYGDCKDKATLLSAMLSSIGVHSALMMVDDRRGAIDPKAPSILADHMVTAIEVPEGYRSPKLRSVITAASGKRYLIFDPTWEKTPFGQLEHELQGSYGVLMEGDQSEIVALPVLSPDLNSIRRSATFRLTAEGVLQGRVTEKRYGDSASMRRYLYEREDAQQQEQFLGRVLRQDFASFSVADFKQENLGALHQDLTTSFDLTAQHFARQMGQMLMVRPRVFGTEDLRPSVRRQPGPRQVPIDLVETVQAQDDFEIKLPAGYTAEELPEPVSLTLDFASYESATTLLGDTLHFHRSYTVRQVLLPAERFADLERLAAVIATDEQSNAILKKL